MRCLTSAAALLLCIAFPALAQHGGGMHAGSGTGLHVGVPHAGFQGRPGVPLVSGPPALPIAPSFGSAPPWVPFVGNLSTTLRPNNFGTPGLPAGTLPGLAGQGGRRGRGQGFGGLIFPGVVIPGFVDPSLAGFGSSDALPGTLAPEASAIDPYTGQPYAGQPYAGQPYPTQPVPAGGYPNSPANGYGVAPQGYPSPYGQPYGAPYAAQPGQAYGAVPSPGVPAYPVQPGGAAQAADAAPAAAPREHDLLTIYFVDGRPPEQVRNYALTRTSLLLTGDRMREIPLSVIDLPTTQQVARAAGLDFRLPD